MGINLQGGVALPQALPSARGGEFPAIRRTDTSAAEVPQVQVDTIADVEARRFEQVQRAATNLFKDVYAVSDTTFSIFKDSTGQYITRFTNLRDGRITYIPEPQVLQYLENRQQARQALVEIQA